MRLISDSFPHLFLTFSPFFLIVSILPAQTTLKYEFKIVKFKIKRRNFYILSVCVSDSAVLPLLVWVSASRVHGMGSGSKLN